MAVSRGWAEVEERKHGNRDRNGKKMRFRNQAARDFACHVHFDLYNPKIRPRGDPGAFPEGIQAHKFEPETAETTGKESAWAAAPRAAARVDYPNLHRERSPPGGSQVPFGDSPGLPKIPGT
jgi:hypothetical protein